MEHTLWMNFIVGILFGLLIVGGPLTVGIIYPLIFLGGGFSTFFRKRYDLRDYSHQQP